MTPREATEAIVAAMQERTRYLDFDPDTHTYRVGEKVIPGVSSLITYLKKRGDFYHSSDAERGSAVHECIEHGVPSDLADPEHRGYVAAWEAFCAKEGYTPVARELPVLGPGNPPLWAGTLDSLGYTEQSPMLVGVKTHRETIPKTPPKEWSLQEAAYKAALVAAVQPAPWLLAPIHGPERDLWHESLRMPCVQVSLGPTGEYRVHRLHGDGDPCLSVWPALVQWVMFCRGKRYWSAR